MNLLKFREVSWAASRRRASSLVNPVAESGGALLIMYVQYDLRVLHGP